jgi:hypothetical protein
MPTNPEQTEPERIRSLIDETYGLIENTRAAIEETERIIAHARAVSQAERRLAQSIDKAANELTPPAKAATDAEPGTSNQDT